MYGVKNEGIYLKERSRRVIKKGFMEEGGTDLGIQGWVVLKTRRKHSSLKGHRGSMWIIVSGICVLHKLLRIIP